MASNSQQEIFISKGTFKRLCLKKEEDRDVRRWVELPVDGAVYKITDSTKVRVKFWDCHILTIAPKGIQREIDAEVTK